MRSRKPRGPKPRGPKPETWWACFNAEVGEIESMHRDKDGAIDAVARWDGYDMRVVRVVVSPAPRRRKHGK